MTLEVFVGPWTLENECLVYARCSFSKIRLFHAWAVFFVDFVTFWGALESHFGSQHAIKMGSKID